MAMNCEPGADQAPFLPGAPRSQELGPKRTETKTSDKATRARCVCVGGGLNRCSWDWPLQLHGDQLQMTSAPFLLLGTSAFPFSFHEPFVSFLCPLQAVPSIVIQCIISFPLPPAPQPLAWGGRNTGPDTGQGNGEGMLWELRPPVYRHSWHLLTGPCR